MTNQIAQEKLTGMTTDQLKGLEAKLTRTINNAPMLADDQLATLSASWEAVIKELSNRITQFFVDRASDYPVGSGIMSQDGHNGTVIAKVDFDSVKVEWETAV